MAQTCGQSYNSLLNVLHNICIYSNLFYIAAVITAMVAFKGLYRGLGIGILMIAIVSIIHHSNEKVGLGAPVWSVLDVVLANMGVVTALCALIYLTYHNKVNRRLALCTVILGVVSLVMFIFSLIESARAKSNSKTNDPIKSWGGNIFTAENPDSQKDYTAESQQAMYLTYHTMWHVLSGLTVLLWVIAVKP